MCICVHILFTLYILDVMSERVFACIDVMSDQTGVEQLSSLQHLDLAYNLLLEHSQLAPLSLLHCLNKVRKHMRTHTHTKAPVYHLVDIFIFLRYKKDQHTVKYNVFL